MIPSKVHGSRGQNALCPRPPLRIPHFANGVRRLVQGSSRQPGGVWVWSVAKTSYRRLDSLGGGSRGGGTLHWSHTPADINTTIL